MSTSRAPAPSPWNTTDRAPVVGARAHSTRLEPHAVVIEWGWGWARAGAWSSVGLSLIHI
eukprot:7771129-Pyramimonas_sp.AAC.1